MENKKQFLRIMSIGLMLSVMGSAHGITLRELAQKCREGKCTNTEKRQLRRRRIAAGAVGVAAGVAAGAALGAGAQTIRAEEKMLKAQLAALYFGVYRAQLSDNALQKTLKGLYSTTGISNPFALRTHLNLQDSIRFVVDDGVVTYVPIPAGKRFSSYI